MPKAPTFIGARMGRPEKAKPRKMTPPTHVIFPTGALTGRIRDISKIAQSDNPFSAPALTNYICKGEIGNGASEGSLEYKTYGKKTVRLGIQCNYYQRYISNECWGYLNSGNSRKGYFISNDWYFNGVLGQFNVKTGYI